MTRYRLAPSPIGQLVISGDDVVTGIRFERHRGRSPIGDGWRRDDTAFAGAVAELDEWFAGARRSFAFDLRLDGTRLQQRVWAALRAIPFGTTRTYGDVALELGTAARAVGHANARNPLSIVVPCHRLVGARGLTGYAGGLDRKRWLLDHEAVSSSP